MLAGFNLKGLDLSQSSAEVYERTFKVFEVVPVFKQHAMQT